MLAVAQQPVQGVVIFHPPVLAAGLCSPVLAWAPYLSGVQALAQRLSPDLFAMARAVVRSRRRRVVRVSVWLRVTRTIVRSGVRVLGVCVNFIFRLDRSARAAAGPAARGCAGSPGVATADPAGTRAVVARQAQGTGTAPSGHTGGQRCYLYFI